MYTFQPIPPIDTINAHSGFYFMLAFSVMAVIIAKATDYYDEFSVYGLIVLAAIPVGIVAVISWNTGTYKEYANEKVNATLVGFTAESHNENRTSGKTTSVVTVRNLYVTYEVNGSVVVFPAQTGTTYPKTSILYKN